jgi:hypothetical protein
MAKTKAVFFVRTSLTVVQATIHHELQLLQRYAEEHGLDAVSNALQRGKDTDPVPDSVLDLCASIADHEPVVLLATRKDLFGQTDDDLVALAERLPPGVTARSLDGWTARGLLPAIAGETGPLSVGAR